MTVVEYIKELNAQYGTGRATEHSYRPALKELLQSLLPKMTVINEPKRYNFGAPDYILMRNDVPVAFLEAKDFVKTNDLAGRKENKEQFDRYKQSLDNIIFTDYLDFWLYRNGEFVDSVRLAELKGDKIVLVTENEAKFVALIEHLANAQPQKITSSKRLAEIMAGKARLLADVISKSLTQDIDEQSDIYGQMQAFKEVLMHDITPESFADIYAQTIAYGMFAARLHDETPDTFSRQEAASLIPRTNPFLRQMFQYIAGYDLDERVSWIVDDLAEAFRASDINKVMEGYGKRTRQNDPMIHFYEDFLKAYDQSLRKSCGVYYTPQPAVSYIVRAVDEILQTEFGLPMGLADTSKTKVTLQNQKVKKRDNDTYEDEMHRVQILDPATGTGTFLAEVIRAIHDKMKGQQGMWQSYVEKHLLPRLNGFELLVASYAMAHLKLDIVLSETGYEANNNQRLRVYLTNSLEEHHPDAGTLFANALSNEANQASYIKRDAPVMVVIGNPPYNLKSKNNSPWIKGLLNTYKEGLNEKKVNINDDYIKFIRLAHHFVDKNNDGIVAYITNNSFIGGLTHRQMRKALLQSFDKVYIFNLHGFSRDASTNNGDENIFDIQQGVSINIFVKTGKKKADELAKVMYFEMKGNRQDKYEYLSNHGIASTPFEPIEPVEPTYYFVPKSIEGKGQYEDGVSIKDLFEVFSNGIETKCDEVSIRFSYDDIAHTVRDFRELSIDELKVKYAKKESASWTYEKAQRSIIADPPVLDQVQCFPFDYRYTAIQRNSGGFIGRSRYEVMHNLLSDKNNLALIVPRQTTQDYRHSFVTNRIVNGNITASAKLFGTGSVFPLYVYPTDVQTSFDGNYRKPNLDMTIVGKIADKIGLQFESEQSGSDGTFAPIDLFDYIYGVLHTPSYREQYNEFLQTDFPRIPYPADANEFRRIAKLGGELRKVHLMEAPLPMVTEFNVKGSKMVEAVKVTDGNGDGLCKLWINNEQYFDNVPRVAWEFYIGGYQPAQKWLKDRKGMKLEWDDVMHYQRIISALCKTHELMQQLDA